MNRSRDTSSPRLSRGDYTCLAGAPRFTNRAAVRRAQLILASIFYGGPWEEAEFVLVREGNKTGIMCCAGGGRADGRRERDLDGDPDQNELARLSRLDTGGEAVRSMIDDVFITKGALQELEDYYLVD